MAAVARPPDEKERRPQPGSGAQQITSCSHSSATDDRTALLRALAACTDQQRRWAMLGYRLGVEHGRELTLARIGQAGDDIRVNGVPWLRWPTHAELERRRRGER